MRAMSGKSPTSEDPVLYALLRNIVSKCDCWTFSSPVKRWSWRARKVFWEDGGRVEKDVVMEVSIDASGNPWPGMRVGMGTVIRGASIMILVPRGMGTAAITPRPLPAMGWTV